MVEGPLRKLLKGNDSAVSLEGKVGDREIDRYKNTHVEVKRISTGGGTHGDTFNYKIVGGNPLTGDTDWEVKVNKLKINDVAFACTERVEFSEYKVKIEVEVVGDLANIIVIGRGR